MSPTTAATIVNRLFTRAALLLASAFLVAAGTLAVPAAASAATNVSGAILLPTTWTLENSPYVVTGTVTVGPLASLSIEPGVAVKFSPGTGMNVQGILTADGTAEAPVCFTAYSDDSCGGDTNGDGESSGTPGYWYQVTSSGAGSVTLRHSRVSWGGRLTGYVSSNATLGACLRVEGSSGASAYDTRFTNCAASAAHDGGYGVEVAGGSFTAERCEFDHGYRGIWHIGGSAAVRDSSFHDLSDYGIASGSASLNYVSYSPVSLEVTRTEFAQSSSGVYLSVPKAIIADSYFRNNSGTALTLAYGTAATIAGTSFFENGTGLLSSSTGTVAIKDSSFVGNTTYAVRNTNSATVLNAAGNYWGGGQPYVEQPGITSQNGNRVSQYVDVSGYLDVDPTIPTPTVSSAAQAAGSATLAEGSSTDSKSVTLSAAVSSPAGRRVRAQFQVLPADQAFTAGDATTGVFDSAEVPSGATASAATPELADGAYHWRVRAVDSDGRASSWTQLGQAGNVDFTVEYVDSYRVCLIKIRPFGSNDAGYDNSHFTSIATETTEYYLENSYGRVRLDFDILNNGAWSDITDQKGTEEYYGKGHIVEMIETGLTKISANTTSCHIVVAIHAGMSLQGGGVIPTKMILTTTESSGNLRKIYDEPTQLITVSENDDTAAWAHEIGHALGVLLTPQHTAVPDRYENVRDFGQYGELGKWDVMATPVIGSKPTHMSSYTKVFLDWLKEVRYVPTTVATSIPVASLTTSSYGGMVPRIDVDGVTGRQYYLLEARTNGQTYSKWDRTLPISGGGTGRLVLYQVDTLGLPRYGYSVSGPYLNLMYSQRHIVTIPPGGILDPVKGDSYSDYNKLVTIKAKSENTSGDKYNVQAEIKSISANDITIKVWGANLIKDMVFGPTASDLWPATITRDELGLSYPPVYQESVEADLLDKQAQGFYPWLLGLIALFLVMSVVVLIFRKRLGWSDSRMKILIVLSSTIALVLSVVLTIFLVTLHTAKDLRNTAEEKRNDFFMRANSPLEKGLNIGATVGGAGLVTSDLHLSCPDGRHVGLNYATGEFENQVDGSIVSGPMGGAPEWIYVPDVPANAGCSHYVSSFRVQQYLTAHPEIAAQVPDSTETYELYARTIDPSAGIFTSATVAGSIEPGEEVAYAIAVAPDGTPTVAEAPSDTDAPALAVSSPLDGALTGGASVTVTGHAPDAGSGLAAVTANGAACALDGGAFTCAGVPLAEGPNEVVVAATDSAGNAAAVTLHVSRDSVAPETVVDAAPSGWTASAEAVVSFSSDEPGSTFLCSIDGAGAAPCLSPATLSGLADGPHSLSVAAVDQAGNADATPAVAEWSVDATAPTASISSPAPGLLTNSPSIDVTVAASDSGSGVASVAIGEITCAASAPDLWTCATVPLAEGDSTVAVAVTDLAGNSSPASFAVTSDTVAPSASGASASLASGSVAASAALSDASGVASAAVAVRGPFPSSSSVMSFPLAPDSSSGVWSASAALPPQSAMPDGRYEVIIEAADAAGNAAEFAAGSFSLDRSSPEAPDVSVAPSVARPGVPVAVAVFAADASSGVASVSVRDAATGTAISLALTSGNAASGTWTGELAAALPEDGHSLAITVTDAEGNATFASASLSVDATAPTLAVTSAPSALTNSAAASVSFSADDAAASFLCSLDGAEAVACASPFAVAALADGAHSVSVTAVDPAGNASGAASASWTVDTAAPVTAVLSGPAAASLTRSAAFNLSATEPGSTFLCSLDGAGAVACASPYAVAGLADGPHLISVAAVDPAGNSDATPAEWRWSVAAPVCPVLAVSGAFSTSCTENADGSTLVSLVGDKWRQAFAVMLPFGASPAAPSATVGVTADDHNRNRPALSFSAALPAGARASLTIPRGHAAATYVCVGVASLEVGPGCPGTRVAIPAAGQSAPFGDGRTIAVSADAATVTVTGY